MSTWQLNDLAPLSAGQSFDAPASPWAAQPADALVFLQGWTAGSAIVKSYAGSGGIVSGGASACAKGKSFAASGLIQSAGAADKSKIKAFSPAGGMVSAGSSLNAKVKSFTGAGSAVMAGSAALARTRSISGDGLVYAAGAAITFKQTAVQTFTYAASGQAVMAGVAGVSRSRVYLSSGALVSSGQAGLARVRSYSASGGAAISGSAVLARSKAFAASGGTAAFGAALLSVTRSRSGSGQVVAGSSASVARTFDFIASSGQVAAAGTAEAQLVRAYLWQASGSAEVSGAASLARTWVPEINWLNPLALDFAGTYAPQPGAAVNLDFSAAPRGILLSGSALAQQVSSGVQHVFLASGGVTVSGDGAANLYPLASSATTGMPVMPRQKAAPTVRTCTGSGGIALAGSARVMRVIVGGSNGAVTGSTGSASVSVTHAPAAVAPVSFISGAASASFGFDPESEAILLLLAA